jgi:hypothetical protein
LKLEAQKQLCVLFTPPFYLLRAISSCIMKMPTHSWLSDLSSEFCELCFSFEILNLIHLRLQSATEGTPEKTFFLLYSIQYKHQVAKKLGLLGAPSTFVSNENFTVIVRASMPLLCPMLKYLDSLQETQQSYTFFLRQRSRLCIKYHSHLSNYLFLNFHLFHMRFQILLRIHWFRTTASTHKVGICPALQLLSQYLRFPIGFLPTPPLPRLQICLLLKNLWI